MIVIAGCLRCNQPLAKPQRLPPIPVVTPHPKPVCKFVPHLRPMLDRSLSEFLNSRGFDFFRRFHIGNGQLFWTPSIPRSMERIEVSHDGSYILLAVFLCE